MNVISNAFSLNMLDGEPDRYFHQLSVVELEGPNKVPRDVMSVVGHPDMAKLLTEILGFEVPVNRQTFKIKLGDVLYVAQYSGSRLPAGATTLPEGAKIRFFKVDVTF